VVTLGKGRAEGNAGALTSTAEFQVGNRADEPQPGFEAIREFPGKAFNLGREGAVNFENYFGMPE
jgi:hypothetical protein